MRVNAISSSMQTIESVNTSRVAGRGRSAKTHGPEKSGPKSDAVGETSALETPSKGPKSGRAHGVLRLLAAGHFKPVAEQRLRANFADLLPPTETEAAAEEELELQPITDADAEVTETVGPLEEGEIAPIESDAGPESTETAEEATAADILSAAYQQLGSTFAETSAGGFRVDYLA